MSNKQKQQGEDSTLLTENTVYPVASILLPQASFHQAQSYEAALHGKRTQVTSAALNQKGTPHVACPSTPAQRSVDREKMGLLYLAASLPG